MNENNTAIKDARSLVHASSFDIWQMDEFNNHSVFYLLKIT